MAKLIKFAKMAGVMHEADHTYSTQSTCRLHQLATDVPFIACVNNWPCTFKVCTVSFERLEASP